VVKPERYLELIHRAKEAVKIPVIGSLNGITNEGWIDYARKIAEAGADGLELNIYWNPTDAKLSGAEVEQRYLDIIKSVKASVKIPMAVKLSPFFSAFANMAQRIDATGVDALVLFNRFYQPDFDLEELEVVPHLNLSSPYEIRLPLMWIAVLFGRLKASLGATRGVHSQVEVVKYLMAGADAVMMTSVLLQHGIQHLCTVLARPGALDGGARVQLGRADEGLHEPGVGGGSGILRAGQLHPDAGKLQSRLARQGLISAHF
jgi:dihydroorotate dehydrogenase (fumarate)